MARPRLEVGTFGDIRATKTDAGTYQALARYRDWDGRVRRVTATADTKARAVMELKKRIAHRDPIGDTGETVTPDMPFGDVCRIWLENVKANVDLADGTKDTYERELRTLITPTFQYFTLREITVARVERFLHAQGNKSYARAKHSRVLLNLIMRFAMRHGAIPRNPVDSTTPLRRPVTTPKALTMDELTAIRRAARQWHGRRGAPGPKPDGQLWEIIEVMLGTSARIGEALALRRCDVDLENSVVHICGTVVFRKGKGVYRQDRPKTDSSDRWVAIPSFAADVLRARIEARPDADPEELVFRSAQGTALAPYNVRRTFRMVLEQAGLGGRKITPHAFRRTVATIISREADDRLAAQTLGQVGVQTAKRHYIEPSAQANPAVAEILEQLAPGEAEERPAA